MADSTNAALIDLSLQHLQAELARIDLLIRRQVDRWRLANQDPADGFRGLYVTDDEIDELLARPLGTNWGHGVQTSPIQQQSFAHAYAKANQKAQALVEMARSQGEVPRLLRLSNTFDLDRFELDVFLVCLAPSLDLRYERLYSYLQDDVTRRSPSVNLALDLLTVPGSERFSGLAYFTADAHLFKHRLLDPVSDADSKGSLLSRAFAPDPTIVSWLLGQYSPHAELRPWAAWFPAPLEIDETDKLLAADAWQHMDPLLEELSVLVFWGGDQAAQLAAARLCAARLGRPLLTVDLAGAIQSGLSPLAVLRLALRDARLTGAVPHLAGWDTCLTDGKVLPPEVLAELCAYPDWIIACGETPWQATGIDRARAVFRVEFPIPDGAQRESLWQHFVAQAKASQHVDVTPLASQFALTSGQIRDAVNAARDMACQNRRPLQTQDLLAAARAHSNPRLSSLARKITPRYTWSDITLPDDQLAQLREIVDTVRGRSLVLEAWGVGRKLASSAGVTVLFAGPPGTGKTMSAEIIASELGLDLYKIDLSTIVSKYIGETEKNLERIFSEAQSSNAILFFDEADAIFGKRSEVKDAHDRYANIEVSYLLQRMEAYDGVTVLATNLRANLDEAFTRRLQFAVDFPFPEEDDRLHIWQTLFPPELPRESDLDLSLFARRFKLAGGSIRNIIVSAAYLAASDGGQVTMKHLLHSTRREMQKMGRLVNEQDMNL
jgi:ATP-dependent 26S proteasome regulatory subunit